jgi:hypothetical protein
MSTKPPLWLSIARNAYNPNSGTPAITQGMTQWFVCITDYAQLLESDTSFAQTTKYFYGSSNNITGFRGLPITLIEDIFLFAAQESSYTRWALTRVCGSWRRVAVALWRLWASLYIAGSSTWYDQVPLSIEGHAPRYRRTLVHVHLNGPTAQQLYDLVASAPTTHWESLRIQLNSPDVAAESINMIFAHAEFPNLTSLYIEETGDFDLIEKDPYAALYEAIFLTATKLESLYVNSELKGVAPQYGLFGQAVKSLGGSPSFVRDALPQSPEANTYSHITRLSLHSWNPEMFRNLNLPNLCRLKVDHCLHDDNWIHSRIKPSVPQPSLLEVRLTTHSLAVLPQLCAGGLEVLVIDKDYDRWDGCLPPTAPGLSSNLSVLILDVWSTASLEQVEIHTPINLQHLLSFLHNAKALRDLTLAVPNDSEWCTDFTSGMGARWGPDRHLAHCPHLEYLTLQMDWDYREGEWVEEIRLIFDAREGTAMRSVVCRWTGDARQVESGPAGNFGALEGEYYCPMGEPDIGPNLPHDAKQVESHADEVADTEDEEMISNTSEDWDDDDMFGSYTDISFP